MSESGPKSHGYLENLLENLNRQRPDVNARLFTAILLCLVAGERNLLIRTEEDAISDVAAAAADILVSVFGLPTQRIQAHKSDQPDTFFKSLFLVPPPSRHTHARTSSSRRAESSHRLSYPKSGSRAASLNDDASSLSTTEPSTSSYTSPKHETHNLRVFNDSSSIRAIRPDSGHGYSLEAFRASHRQPSITSGTSHLETYRTTPGRTTSFTYAAGMTRSPKLPHALVLTKIERSGVATQCAISEMLRTRTVSLAGDEPDSDSSNHQVSKEYSDDQSNEWNLPSGFCVVYVCGLGSGTERPPLLPFLLDAFSFNITVLLDVPMLVLPAGLLRSAHPLVTISDIEELRHMASHHAHISAHLDTYVMNLLLAVRHHSHLQGSLIGVQCTQDMDNFIHSARVLFGSGPPTSEATPDDKANGHLHSEYNHNLSEGLNSHQATVKESLYCTEKDVARIFAGVLAHRLGVQKPLEGPLRSLLLPAVDVSDSTEDLIPYHSKSPSTDIITVYGVLAGILRSI